MPMLPLCNHNLNRWIWPTGVILVATQFRSNDDSFGRLQLCNKYLSHATDCMRVCTNRTIVTSQMNHHMILIGWQQGCKHVSWFHQFLNQNYNKTATSVKGLYYFALTLTRSSGPLPKCFTLWFLCSLFDRLLNWLECLTAPRGDVIWTWTTHCPYTRSVFCVQSALLYSTLGKELELLCLCKQGSESNECPVWETLFEYYVAQFPSVVECTGCDYC